MEHEESDVHWAPRVSKTKVRRLYESDAKGILDEELLDDVDVTLWLRCRSILDVAEAKQGRVRCQRCELAGRETIIQRPILRREEQEAWTIVCPACGWTVPWKEFVRSFKKRQLNSGGAMPAFEHFAKAYPSLREPKAKMLAIDRLIHEFHHSYRASPGLPTRPVGPNIIDGKVSELIPFLDELTYGDTLAREASETRAAWQRDITRWRKWVRAGYPLTPDA